MKAKFESYDYRREDECIKAFLDAYDEELFEFAFNFWLEIEEGEENDNSDLE